MNRPQSSLIVLLLKGHGRFRSLLTHEMFLTICQELQELFTEDEVESCFGDESDDEECEAHFEHRRLRDRQNSLEYDPDNDDYQMIVTPCLSESIEYEEKRLIQKQIHQLFHRIQGGGVPEILDHYHKVREDLVLQLAQLHGSAHLHDRCKDEVMSSRSTCDTDLTNATSLEAPSAKMPPSMIMGPQSRRISRGSAFDSISDVASWLPLEGPDVMTSM
eukprot:s369_g32.t1